MDNMNTIPLVYIPKIKPKARLRLICFSYAGGNAGTYLSWQKYLHSDVELAVIQLPGRGARLSDPPFRSMNEMVKAIFIGINQLPPKPSALYGHSMGARVAYELTLMFFRFGLHLPVQVIASGSIAPNICSFKEKTYSLPDKEFIEKIKDLNGTSEEVIKNTEFMKLVLPTLRADFEIIETYINTSKLIIPTKVSIFAGKDDKIEQRDIEEWFKIFVQNTGIHWINGGHFFVDTHREEVLSTINSLIEITLSESLTPYRCITT